MSVDNAFDDFFEEDVYKFKRVGSFGRFSTIDNFPIEFFLTTFDVEQLSDLTFAREIKPASIDFEQLLQRDIDEERVKNEIEPYLTSSDLKPSEKKAKSVFFPPLLVAAVPVENKTMQSHYPPQEFQEESNYLNRTWHEHFKLKLRKAASGYKITPSLIHEDSFTIAKEPAVFEAKISKGRSNGVKLVVIDGQHRLKALLEAYDANNQVDFSELAVPICILFSPNSTSDVSEKLNTESFSIPTVPQIFRQLFVDVNKNAVSVGGHFSILLSEGNMGSAICREFCKYVLDKSGIEGLAQIEWNQKNKKLTTEITKHYYLTSIGVIDKALNESFSKSKNVFNYFLSFEDIEDLVHPDDDNYLEYPQVSWDRFSLSQKKIIENQLLLKIVPTLYKLFFESKLYRKSVNIFNSELINLKNKAESDPKGKINYEPVVERILAYVPINLTESQMRLANANYKKFEEDIFNQKEDFCFSLSGHAIFQRALIFALHEFLKVCKASKVNSDIASDLFIFFIDLISDDLNNLVSPKYSYCQSFVYNVNKVSPTADVRKGLGFILLSLLQKGEVIKVIEREVNGKLNERDKNNLLEELKNLGYRSVNSYFELYTKSKTRDFKASYQIDRDISQDDREELYQLELLKKKDEKDFRDGIIKKSDISTKFDDLIQHYVEKETDNAREELRRNIDLQLDVFGLKGIFSDTDTIFSSSEDE
ncbi:TPA: hypothetical protein ACGUTS_003010 [Vibrio vulnificus]